MSGDRFMRPMRYQAELAQLRSPRQVLMEDLGLADDEPKEQTSSSDSDCPDGDHSQSYQGTPVPVLNTDMKQMLRETQRKLRMAQTNLTESEQNRERRLKIMKKTHTSALTLKQALIQDLQDIVSEKDEVISELEFDLKKCHCENSHVKKLKTERNDLKKLVQQLTRLQKDYVTLQGSYEQAAEGLKQAQNEKENLHDELTAAKDIRSSILLKSPAKPFNSELTQQVRKMQQRVVQLEQERLLTSSHTSIEKQLQVQVEELKADLKTLQKERKDLIQDKKNKTSQLKSLQINKEEQEKLRQMTSSGQQKISFLETENESLKVDLLASKTTVKEMSSDTHQQNIALGRLKADLEKESDMVVMVKKEKEVLNTELCTTQNKVRELSTANEELEEHIEKLETERNRFKEQLVTLEMKQAKDSATLARVAQLQSSLSSVSSNTTDLHSSISDLRSVVAAMDREMYKDISNVSKKISQRIAYVSEQNQSLVSKYRREMSLRKKLHNQLVELRGNIRVICRVRPTITEDGYGSQLAMVVEPDRDDDGVVHVLSRGTWKTFDMDKVFGISSTQEEVFSEVQSLVTSCIDGYNVCIFAYGQTGSGKTFTMEGPLNNPGINQRALLQLFKLVEERRGDYDYSIVVSVVEIYNECVRDLLGFDHTVKLDIKQTPDGVYVPGLTQVAVSQLDEVNEVFALGHANRSTGSTKMNIQSSRSHALLCINVIGLNRTTGVQTIGKLNLIDLAGSERLNKSGSDGVRMEEAKHINKSLSSLGDVIHHLRAKSPHIPYRNSKLTYLLQDSLCGDSKTLMMVQVSPVENNAGETVCSLNFAQRVRVVELGQASKKTVNQASKVK